MRFEGQQSDCVMTKDETAKFTRLCTKTLDRMYANGSGPVRIYLSNKRVGYLKSDVLAWLESRKVAA